MKQAYILFLIATFFIKNLWGQTSTTVYTCKGGTVSAWINADISQQAKDQIRQQKPSTAERLQFARWKTKQGIHISS